MHKNIKGKITSSGIHNHKLEWKLEPLFYHLHFVYVVRTGKGLEDFLEC